MAKRVTGSVVGPKEITFHVEATLNLGGYENVKVGWEETWPCRPGEANQVRRAIEESVLTSLDKQCREFIADFDLSGRDAGQVALSYKED